MARTNVFLLFKSVHGAVPDQQRRTICMASCTKASVPDDRSTPILAAALLATDGTLCGGLIELLVG